MLTALLLCLAAGGAAANQRVAIIPVAADRVSVQDVKRLEALDTRLRRAARKVPGHEVQPRETTSAHIDAARELGLTCAIDDALCAGKLSVLAEVDMVVLPIVGLGDGAVALTLLLFGPGDTEPRAEVVATVPESALHEATLTALLTTLLVEQPAPLTHRTVAPDAATLPAPAATKADPAPPSTGEAPPTRADPPPAEEAPTASSDGRGGGWLGTALVVAGGIGAAVGLLGAVAFAGGAGVIELLLNFPRDYQERLALQLFGVGMLAGVAAGVVVAGLGGAVAAGSLFVE